MKIGSFFPGAHYSSLYAMAGDDCSLFFDLEKLTEKQKADHLSNVELTAMLQIALTCVGHDNDHVALYEQFASAEWKETVRRYHGFFSRMTQNIIPLNNFSYHPKNTYYDSVATYVKKNPNLTDATNLYMSSGSNKIIHNNENLLEINRNVNSKKHFAENAPSFGIPVPNTLVTTKAELQSDAVKDFFLSHRNKIIIKLLGLAGARNVAPVSTIGECEEYVAEYDESMIILLQERLDLKFYKEMTVDLVVSKTEIRIDNIREILFADGIWVGNLIGKSVTLSEKQTRVLLKVGEYARHHGYVSDEGSNCGIDFFIGKDGSLVVTEINARWTGGLFPAQILGKIDSEGKDAVAFFDIVLIEKKESYLNFLDRYLVGEHKGAFSMIPIGFGCFPISIENKNYFYTWQAVLGDLDSFKQVKNDELGEGAMITADKIKIKVNN